MAKVEQKSPIIEEIKANFDGAKSVVLVDYLGLTVEQDTNLRRATRSENVIYKVYKNTYIKRAIEGTEFADLAQDLEGPTAVAISKEDATAPARVMAQFAKKADKLELKSGVVEGTYYDKNGIAVIAEIPSREELLSRLVGSLQSPITNLARVIKQVAEQKDGGVAAEA
ncbi:MAG: 50S ribosomal protein L10 [Lachnospiraceae bacterium]|nr:50S ribosomal protein L10 [Lachnospiraceae bacterium]